MNDLKAQWEAEEKFSFKGWDFSHIDTRWDCPEPPWNYQKIVKSHLKNTDILLDMGTGGGEILREINHIYENTYATEAFAPNYELCKKELSSLGITVVQTHTDDKLPFENSFFDCIINRHESFDLNEVDRALKPGGYFITQQVGNKNDLEIAECLVGNFVPHSSKHTLSNYINTLEKLGYEIITKDEFLYSVKFFDVGALVYYAKIIVWEFPGFTVESHLDKLNCFQREIDEKGFIEGTGHRFLIVARKL